MLIKLIFLLQLTLSPQGEKEKKIRTIRKSGGPQRDKILRRLKKGTRNDIFRKRTLRLRSLFEFLLPVINFCRPAPFDTLVSHYICVVSFEKVITAINTCYLQNITQPFVRRH